MARLAYGIVPAGSILTVYFFAAVYLFAVLGLGLLISTYADSQQQAMLISFFLMMIFVLMSGLYTSIESMPAWAREKDLPTLEKVSAGWTTRLKAPLTALTPERATDLPISAPLLTWSMAAAAFSSRMRV